MKKYRILTTNPRGAGATYAIAEAVAKKVDAVIVCASSNEAGHISNQHKIKAVSMNDPDKYIGVDCVKLWDANAVDRLADIYEMRISELKREILDLKKAKNNEPCKTHEENPRGQCVNCGDYKGDHMSASEYLSVMVNAVAYGKEIYKVHPTGGWCHVVIDDDNVEDYFIRGSMKASVSAKDNELREVELACMALYLHLTIEDRIECNRIIKNER